MTGELDKAYELARALEKHLGEAHALARECDYWCRRTGHPSIGGTIKGVMRVVADLSRDIEFSEVVGCRSALGSNIASAKRLAIALDDLSTRAHKIADEIMQLRPFGFHERASQASAISLTRDLARRTSGTRNTALAVAHSVAETPRRTWNIEVIDEIERLLASFIQRDRERDALNLRKAALALRSEVVPSALKITVLASIFAATDDRLQYKEEWLADLYWKARCGATRKEQLRHAWHNLIGTARNYRPLRRLVKGRERS